MDVEFKMHRKFLKSGSWDKWGKLETNQKKIDNLLGVDGEDEFTLYIAPLGKIK